MADPFSTAAGVFGVISLTIQVTQIMVKFGMDWKEAPEAARLFMAELKTLKTVLSETHTNILLNPDFAAAFDHDRSVLLSQIGPSAPDTTDSNVLLGICKSNLEHLLTSLSKRSKDSNVSWERLKGAFQAKDTRQSVQNLSRQFQMLNNLTSIDSLVLGATTLKEVKEGRKEQQEWYEADTKLASAINAGVVQLNKSQVDQEKEQARQKILTWISEHDYTALQNDNFGRRQAGTGQWLLDCGEFQEWLCSDKHTLFCPGMPGAGKTTLAAFVIHHLNRKFLGNPNVGISYIYLSYKRHNDQRVELLLSSLLKQLSSNLNPLPDCVKSLYDNSKNENTQPSVNDIISTLQAVIALYSTVFIVVDALDECQYPERFLSELPKLQEAVGTRTKLLITSRPILDIKREFEGDLFREIIASDEDVRTYLESQMYKLPRFITTKPHIREEIVHDISEAVEGVYLLAQLYLESLRHKTTVKEVRNTLKAFKKQSKECNESQKLVLLSKIYDEAMSRINSQGEDSKSLALSVISWITCAVRPLSTREIQYAVAITPEDPFPDEDGIPEIDTILSVCAGLVTVDQASNVIRLVHYTTQEYFQHTQQRCFPEVEYKIATICGLYLSDCQVANSYSSEDEYMAGLEIYPLFKYAAVNWADHAQKAAAHIPTLLKFLTDNRKVSVVVKFRNQWRPGMSSSRWPWMGSGLHLAASCGISHLVEVLLKIGIEVDAKTLYDQRTPLSYAAENGHEAVVRLLAATGKVNLDSQDKNKQTPCSYAAENGHESIVRFLYETKRVNIDSWDTFRSTPLSYAARNGHEAVFRMLYFTGMVELDSRSFGGRTPLSVAAEYGHQDIVEFLVKVGVKGISLENDGSSINNRYEFINKYFDKTGSVEIDSKDTEGRTPLSYAAQRGHETVVRYLHEVGKARTNSADAKGRNPISYAAEKGHEAVVRYLHEVNKGAVESKDKEDGTPISYAAHQGQVAVVRYLHAIGKVDIESRDKEGLTPIQHATRWGHKEVVQYLHETGKVDIQSTDDANPWSLIFVATTFRQEAVVRYLYQTGEVDIETKTSTGESLIAVAAEGGSESIVRYLHETGKANIEAKDKYGRTPIFHAAKEGRTNIVKYLYETGKVDINAKSNSGFTLLSWAAAYRQPDVVKFILDTGKADLSAKNSHGRTALTIAYIILLDEVEYHKGPHDKVYELLRDAFRAERRRKILDLNAPVDGYDRFNPYLQQGWMTKDGLDLWNEWVRDDDLAHVS